ncbi:MAG: PQ-loop domain-containing transporter [Gudongella sp.]|jgi:hypothetical protein|nr:PQ-loop domain-containing transporter [Gudongella sp.]
MSIFEALMLLCFGVAWPFSIMRSYKSRSVEGKSPYFLIVIIIGYISGIINKLLNSNDIVMYLYVLNFLMVSTDLVLYYRNVRYMKESKA